MIRTGIDLIKIERIKKLIQDEKFVERVYSPTEVIKLKPENLAGIFALKEAFFKATQIKIKKWNEINVNYHKNGKPYIEFDSSLLNFKIKSIDCSISHDGEYATAIVVIED